MDEKLLESALKRQFMIHIKPRPGYPTRGERTMMIGAFSEAQARKDALRKVRTKEFKNRKAHDWVIVSVEAIDTYVEPSNS